MDEAAGFRHFPKLGVRFLQHVLRPVNADTRQHGIRGLPEVLLEGPEKIGPRQAADPRGVVDLNRLWTVDIAVASLFARVTNAGPIVLSMALR